jgi:hypothetical protein
MDFSKPRTSSDTIAELRQQVENKMARLNDVTSEYQHAVKQLALRELEILKLREALGLLTEMCITHVGADYGDEVHKRYLQGKEALSTPLTTEYLNEWLKEKLGEPVATTFDNGITFHTDFYEPTKLYAVKELK